MGTLAGIVIGAFAGTEAGWACYCAMIGNAVGVGVSAGLAVFFVIAAFCVALN